MSTTISDRPTALRCPKCEGPMRSYERGGIHVDQCTDCRGVFLDRGELEHLVSLEARAYERVGLAAPASPGGPDGRRDDRGPGIPPGPRQNARDPRPARSQWDDELDGLGWPGGDDLDLDWDGEGRGRSRRSERRGDRPGDRPGGRRRNLLGELFEVFGE